MYKHQLLEQSGAEETLQKALDQAGDIIAELQAGQCERRREVEVHLIDMTDQRDTWKACSELEHEGKVRIADELAAERAEKEMYKTLAIKRGLTYPPSKALKKCLKILDKKRLERHYGNLLADTCDTDTIIRTEAMKVLTEVEVNGEPGYCQPIEEIVRLLVARVQRKKVEIALDCEKLRVDKPTEPERLPKLSPEDALKLDTVISLCSKCHHNTDGRRTK